MSRRIRKPVLTTILLVGEGKTEVAFLSHLKSLYIQRNCGIKLTIKNARGKGPEYIVNFAIRQRNNTAYDRVAVLLDTDLAWSDAVRKSARKNKLTLLGSTPCIEGFLLDILMQHVPPETLVCKQRCTDVISGSLFNQESFQAKFAQEFLETRRGDIAVLDRLLKYFEK